MPSAKIVCIHASTSSPPPPPRYPKDHEGDDAVLLNRMRAAVVTHYRTSPSAPDRPIDLTRVHEDPFVSLMSTHPKNDQGGGNMIQQEIEDEDAYVPPSLADYVANVHRALEEEQMAFLHSTTLSSSETRDEQNDPDALKHTLKHDLLLPGRSGSSSSYNDSVLWSPESCFRSPPPLNPVALLTDTQLQKQALSSFSQDEPLLRSLPPLSLSAIKRKVVDPPAASPPRPLSLNLDIIVPSDAAPSNSTVQASPDHLSSAGQEVVIVEEAASEEISTYCADSDVLPEQKDLMNMLSSISYPDQNVAPTKEALSMIEKDENAAERDSMNFPPKDTSSKEIPFIDSPGAPGKEEPSPMAALLTRASSAPSSRTKTVLRMNPSDEDTDPRFLMLKTSSSTDTNKMASAPKRIFSNRPPTSPKSLISPPPRRGDVTRTSAIAPSSFNNHRQVAPAPIVTKDTPPKPLSTASTPSPLSMSSANQAAFGVRGAFQPSSSSTSTISSIPASPVPRFCSPPSSPRVKTALRFTAETADRLSRPSKTPPPHYKSPLKKNNNQPKRVTARSSDSKHSLVSPQLSERKPSVATHPSVASMQRPSEPSSALTVNAPKPKYVTSPKQEKIAREPLQLAPRLGAIDSTGVPDDLAADMAPVRRRSMDRLVRHSKVLKNGRLSPFSVGPAAAAADHSDRLKIDTGSPTMKESSGPSYKLAKGFELSLRLSPSQKLAMSPPPVSFDSRTDVIERLSRPTVARMTAIQCTLHPPPPPEEDELPPRPPSPYVFTTETADRLLQPTASRSAAIHATFSPPGHHRTRSGSVCGGSVSSRDGVVENIEERHLPTPLDPSSHLLHSTAVSHAKKTAPKPVIVRPPPAKKYVSGVSDRLMTRTTANRGLVAVPKKPETIEKPRKTIVIEKPKFSVEDGIAKAKERVRQRQLQKKQEEQRKGLPPIRPPMRTPSTGSHRPSIVKRPLTVPCGPRVANIPSAREQQSNTRTEAPTLAQRLDTFGKGLRDDYSIGSQCSSFSRRSLTVPTGPKLVTDIRGGEKYVPPKSRLDVSLAQSTDLLLHGLRSPYHSTHQQRGLTIPISPKFAPVPQRQRPKSSAEIEAEEMEYFNNHRFKAKPPLGQHRPAVPASKSSRIVPGFMKPTEVSKRSQRQDRPVTSSSASKTHGEQRKFASAASRNHLSNMRNVVDPIVEHADRVAKALALREEARQAQLALEEAERQEQSLFKAKPVPRTTYQFKPVVPVPSGPLVEPFSPDLQTKHRVMERREFDLQVQQERAVRLAEVEAMEAARRAEEEEDLMERRRLPVSEGGMIPVAEPINAVLLK